MAKWAADKETRLGPANHSVCPALGSPLQSSGLWLVADIQIIQWQTGIMNDHPHRLDLDGHLSDLFAEQLDYRPGLMWNIRETSNRYHFLVSSEQDGQQHFSITVTRYYAHCENMKEPMNLNFEEVDMALSGQLVEWQVTLRTGSMTVKGSCTHHDKEHKAS
ncbi:hypothetical protein PSPO01_05068 [Paraphaeosphaeria sporulosa]